MKRIESDGKLGDEIRLTSSGVPGKLCKFSCSGRSNKIISIYDYELWEYTIYLYLIEQVYNGIPDWVYEEEVLGTNKAMYFSKR